MDHAATIQGPPFRFDGVTARVFPLRAHGAALQRLCDSYLNLVPEQVSFRPAAPYVMLSLLHYRRMSYRSPASAHHGWVSQNEVLFGVPLDWGRLEHGRWRAMGSAIATPFVLVDQPRSTEIGREVYGWPKQPAELRRELSAWTTASPAEREHVVTVAAETFAAPYTGERPSRVALVDIDRASSSGAGAGPWRAPLGLPSPWWGVSTLWSEAMRLWSSAAARGPAIDLPALLRTAGLVFGGPSAAFHTANLKQVRCVEDPAAAAYQAITLAPMRLTALHRAGLLGEARVALGDPAGGYRIHVHRHPLFPIVETLGLVVESELPGPRRAPAGVAPADHREPRVATLAPVMPFWLEVDLEYGRGAAVWWRSPHVRDGAWHGRTVSEEGAVVTWNAGDPLPSPDGRRPPCARFEPTWGACALPAPPCHYAQLTARVLALPATQDLAGAIARWRPPPEVGSFRLPDAGPPRVLMVVTSCEDIGAPGSAGRWWTREVSFLVPVIWTRHGKDIAALVSAITFADGELAAIAARDTGSEVISAELHAPADPWLDHAGPTADRRLLSLTTSALPALGVDAQAEPRVLLEVVALDRRAAEPAALPCAAPADRDLRLCIVARRRIRDAADPEAIAHDEWFCHHLISHRRGGPGWQRGAGALEVRVHPYPERLDLVGRLALEVARREGSMVHVVPSAFAWAMLDVTHQSSTSLAVRTHDAPWTRPVHPPGAAPCEPQADDAFHRMLAAFGAMPDRCRHG